MLALFCSFCGVKVGEAPSCWSCGRENEFLAVPPPLKVRSTGATTRGKRELLAPEPAPSRPESPPSIDPTAPVPPRLSAAESDKTVPLERKATDPVVALLLCTEGAAATIRHELREGEYTVGRKSAQILIDSEKTSKLHARIMVARCGVGRYTVTVTDLGSTNQTFVNDLELEPHSAHTLNDNDVLTFAEIKFRLRLNNVLRQASPLPDKRISS